MDTNHQTELAKRKATATRIAEYRKRQFSNAGDFAHAVGVSKRTVENWETGASEPSASAVRRIAAVLHTTSSILLGEESEEDALARKIEQTQADLDVLRQALRGRRLSTESAA